MKIRTFATVSALSLLLSTAAFAQSDRPGHTSPAPGSNHESMSAAKDATAGAVGAASSEMTTSTKGFVTAAALSDMYEVEAGNTALQLGQSSDVKDFAKKMVDAHTKTTDELKAILAKDKIDVTPPPALDHRRQGMIDDLRGAKMADFDHRYVAQQVAAHKEAQILMRGYAKSGDNADLKAFAAKTLPIVQDHLAMAEKMEASSPMAANKAKTTK